MFAKATKLKLRFNSTKGALTVEDLWDLPLRTEDSIFPSLNQIAKDLSKTLKEDEEEDFIKPKGKKETLDNLRFDIVKAVIKERLEDSEAVTQAAVKRTERDKLDKLIADKENEELKNMSLEDLKKMREEV